MVKKQKQSKDVKFWTMVLGSGFLLILMSITYFNQTGKLNDLRATASGLESQIASVDAQIEDDTKEFEALQNEARFNASGLKPAQVLEDTRLAEEYFEPAFEWTNGEEYDAMRDKYIEELGSDNSFTSVYLTENVKADSEEHGEVNFIDRKSLRSSFDNMYIVPTKAGDNDRISYIGFVTHYMHQSSDDLVNKSALDESEAIIQFTVAGEEGERFVTDVSAWAGFGRVLDVD